MSEHPFQGWLDKATNYSGILACGVRMPNQSVAVKSFDPAYPEARLKDLLQCLAEVAFGLRNSQLGGSRLRWVFEHGQLYSARRPDGVLAVLALGKDPNSKEAVEELLAVFLATVNTAPEAPALASTEQPPTAEAPPGPGNVS